MFNKRHNIVTFKTGFSWSTLLRQGRLILVTIAFVLAMSHISIAAVVNGEGIDRDIDAPRGPKTVQSLEESEREINNFSTSPATANTSSTAAQQQEQQRQRSINAGNEIAYPEPTTEGEEYTTKTEDKGIGKFIAVGVIVVIIGLGILFGISRSQNS